VKNGPHTILLVEDDPNDVDLLRRAFTKAGVVVCLQVVDDGQKAVDYLAGRGPFADRERHPLPELILLDVKLPRRSGIEVLAWARKQPRLVTTPVIMLSSSRQAVNISRAYELGANSYLVKPVGFQKLQEVAKAISIYWLEMNTDAAAAQ